MTYRELLDCLRTAFNDSEGGLDAVIDSEVVFDTESHSGLHLLSVYTPHFPPDGKVHIDIGT